MRDRLLAIAICLSALFVASRALGQTTRESADHLPFPDVPRDAVFKLNLPLAGMALDRTPEELGAKLYSTDASHDFLERATKNPPDTKWYAVHFMGATVAGIDLEDGRVSKIIFVSQARVIPQTIVNLLTQQSVGKKPPASDGSNILRAEFINGITHKPCWVVYDCSNPIQVAVYVDPVDSFIATHNVAPDVAEAMHQHTIKVGMNLAEVLATLGPPLSQSDNLCLFSDPSQQDVTDGHQEVTTNKRALIPPMSLFELCYYYSLKFNVHFTFEIDRSVSLPGLEDKIQWSNGNNINTEDQLLRMLTDTITWASFSADSLDPKIIHVIQKSLQKIPNYAMDRRISIKFSGVLQDLLLKLSIFSTGSVDAPRYISFPCGRIYDLDTKISVDAINKSYREILSAYIPLGNYSAILWIAEKHIYNNRLVMWVEFQGAIEKSKSSSRPTDESGNATTKP